ncbi:MAG: hypothetical protein R3D29_12795 [Nitratireductor sp.]
MTVIKYDTTFFDLSTLPESLKSATCAPKERTTPQLNPDPNDPYYKDKPGLYRSQIHERFSEMLWPFAYVILMLAYAGQAGQTGPWLGNRGGHADGHFPSRLGIFGSQRLKSDESVVWLVSSSAAHCHCGRKLFPGSEPSGATAGGLAEAH